MATYLFASHSVSTTTGSKNFVFPKSDVGNMWAQSWSGLDYLALPYPNTTFPDVTAELLEKVHVQHILIKYWLIQKFLVNIVYAHFLDVFAHAVCLEFHSGSALSNG